SSADVFIANPAGAIELIGQARLEMRDAEVRRTGSFASLYLGMSTSAALIDASFTDHEGSVVVSDTAAVTITGGEFLDGGAAAVYVDKFGSLSIEGALVTGNSGAAIGVADDATASITRTVIERNGAGVVFMDRAHGTVTGSSFAGNARNA